MKTVIGLMSGTSMDGVDASLIETDGESLIKIKGSLNVPYEESFKLELIENISTGREVEFTWSLVDGTEDACQARSGLVHEGEFVNWVTIHFNTYLVHEFRISYDSGQDYINVNQSILIEYDEINLVTNE